MRRTPAGREDRENRYNWACTYCHRGSLPSQTVSLMPWSYVLYLFVPPSHRPLAVAFDVSDLLFGPGDRLHVDKPHVRSQFLDLRLQHTLGARLVEQRLE